MLLAQILSSPVRMMRFFSPRIISCRVYFSLCPGHHEHVLLLMRENVGLKLLKLCDLGLCTLPSSSTVNVLRLRCQSGRTTWCCHWCCASVWACCCVPTTAASPPFLQTQNQSLPWLRATPTAVPKGRSGTLKRTRPAYELELECLKWLLLIKPVY